VFGFDRAQLRAEAGHFRQVDGEAIVLIVESAVRRLLDWESPLRMHFQRWGFSRQEN